MPLTVINAHTMGELNNSIVLLQVYQSAIFAVLAFFFYSRSGNRSKKYLGWFMVLSAAYGLSRGAGFQGDGPVFLYLFLAGMAMLLVFFPLFYYYLKSLIISGFAFSRRELFHLLPAMLLFLLPAMACFFTDWGGAAFGAADTGMPVPSWLNVIRFTYHLSIYGFFSAQIVVYSNLFASLFRQHRSNIEKAFSYTVSIRLQWVFTLMMLFLLFLFLLGLSQFLGLHKDDFFNHVINLIELLIILLFGLFAILQQEIYPGRETDSVDPLTGSSSFPAGFENGTIDQDTVECVIMQQSEVFNTDIEPCDAEDCCRVKKYAGSGLTERQKKVLTKKLDKLMKEKFFLNGKLTIDDVAEKLGTNSKYLSQVINESQQQNFYTYINAFRIRYAETLLQENQHRKFSIHGIARMAGFSSKSTFNEAFRRITGMTPSEYLGKNSEVVK
jgi:AraC-like DNA-binding protein